MPMLRGAAEPSKGRSSCRSPATSAAVEHGGRGVRGPSGRAAGELHHERHEPDRAERQQQRSRREQQAVARVAPVERDPAAGHRREEQREPERDVPERQHGRREREGHPGARRHRREHARDRGQPERPAGGIEGQGRGDPAGRRRREAARQDALAHGAQRELGRGRPRDARLAAARRGASSGARAARRRARAAEGRFAGSSTTALATDSSSCGGRSGRTRSSGSGPARMRDCVSTSVAARNGWRLGERLPQHHADRPDVGGRGRLLAVQALGRDVGERAGHVAARRQRVELGHLREPEVEQAHVDGRVGLGQQHVRRLHVAVDDPAPVRVRERVEQLRGDLDGAAVADLAGVHRLAQRAAGDVLVGDVDVPAVARERVDALAARMAQRGGGLRLALGAHGRLALARDHLQRDVEAALFVAREPDVTHPSGAKRPQGSVPSKDELLREGSRRHPPLLLRAEENSFPRRTLDGRSGHVMSQRDDDIQFDFFEDEPATSETAQTSRVRMPRRGGSNGDGRRRSRSARRAAPRRCCACSASSRSWSASCCSSAS